MKLHCWLKYSLLGFAAQILIFAFASFSGSASGPFIGKVYMPWTALCDALLPPMHIAYETEGSTILGLLLGVIVYSLLIGAGICFFKRRNLE